MSRAGLTGRLHAFLSWTSHFISCIIWCLPRPLIRLPFTSPFSVCTITLPCLSHTLSQPFLVLPLMIYSTLLFSPDLPNTSLFVSLSLQEIPSIFLQVHTSKAFNLLSSSFLKFQMLPHIGAPKENISPSSFAVLYLNST